MFAKKILEIKKAQKNARNQVENGKGEVLLLHKPGPGYSNPCYRTAPNCKHESETYEHICLKCGDCGREFI